MLTVKDKLIIANGLARLGVDVCEAGFPAASDGDFEVGPLSIKKKIKKKKIRE